MEQFNLNALQFSAAKCQAQTEALNTLLFKDGKKLSFAEFKAASQSVLEQFNQTWLRVEYDFANRSIVMAEKWQTIWKDRDINPYAIYRTREDSRVRPDHAALNGLVLKLDSPLAQEIYPPNAWNCRCTWETTNNGDKLTPESELKDLISKNVDKEFRFNAGVDGIFPKTGSSYFEVLSSANASNSTFFDWKAKETKLNTTIYTPYSVKLAVKDWKKDKNDVVFINKEWNFDILLQESDINEIKGKVKGFENIKECIEKPSVIYGRWKNEKTQKEVILNFVLYDNKNAYICETLNGVIIDAYFEKRDKKIIGVKFLK